MESFRSPAADKMSMQTILLLSQIPACHRCEGQLLEGKPGCFGGDHRGLSFLLLLLIFVSTIEHSRKLKLCERSTNQCRMSCSNIC